MDKILSWVLARVREPSTWAGVALGATAVQHYLAGDPTALVALIGGVFAAVLPEIKKAA